MYTRTCTYVYVHVAHLYMYLVVGEEYTVYVSGTDADEEGVWRTAEGEALSWGTYSFNGEDNNCAWMSSAQENFRAVPCYGDWRHSALFEKIGRKLP